jgi:hypothetical protein
MDPEDRRKIARINEISAIARTSWIGLLAYLAFIFVTLLGVEDADFLVPARQTQLPLVNVSIPTASFFVFAPVLAAALCVYLHLFLIKLWDAIAETPAQIRTHAERPGWIPLSEAIHPWLVNEYACVIKGNGACPKRPLRRLGIFVTQFLVWFAGPFVIWAFWRISMVANNEWLTLLISACLWFVIFATISSNQHALMKLKNLPSSILSKLFFYLFFVFLAGGLARESWRETEGGLERYAPLLLVFRGPDYYQERFSPENS